MDASCPLRPPKKKKMKELVRLLRTLAVEAVFSSAAAVNRTAKSTEGFSQWGEKYSLVIPDRLLAGVYLNTLSRISEACQVRPSGANETTESCCEGFFVH